jgi:hypothetical protein
MNALCGDTSKERFEREREVVRNEIRGHYTTPDGLMPDIVLSGSIPKGPSCTTRPAAATSSWQHHVRGYLHAMNNCTPERATVIVTGNVDLGTPAA